MKIMLVRDRNVLNNNWLIYFANLLTESGHEVIIACDTYAKFGKLAPNLALDEKVRIINLSAKTNSVIKNIYHKLRVKLCPAWFRFKKLINRERPDVLVCYFPVDLLNVTRFQNHHIPIVQMVHGRPCLVTKKLIKKLWYSKSCIKQVHTWQVLLDSYKEDIDKRLEPKNIISIANPVKQYKADEIIDLSDEKKCIVYVARIEKEIKRPHLLVEAFAKVAKDFPDWRVEIWGMRKYPDYEKEIEDFIEAHKIENQVKLMGYADNVEEIYRHADMQAFPSKGEGFSLALADAMSLGLPEIGFKDAYSVNEVIKDGHNGYLVKDVDEFAKRLGELMANKELRIRLGKNAHEDMKAYAPERIIAKWNELFGALVPPHRA